MKQEKISLEKLSHSMGKLFANLKQTEQQESLFKIFNCLMENVNSTQDQQVLIGISLIMVDSYKKQLDKFKSESGEYPFLKAGTAYEEMKKNLNIKEGDILEIPLHSIQAQPYLQVLSQFVPKLPDDILKDTVWKDKDDLANFFKQIMSTHQRQYNPSTNLFPKIPEQKSDDHPEFISKQLPGLST